MKQIKSLYRRLLLPLLGGLALTACEKDNGEETRVSEFGPYKKEIIAPWKGGTGSIPVLANQPYDIELINPDNGWLTLDTEGRGTHFTGDDYFKFQATTNDGFPRMEGIRLWTHNRADTIYIKQEGFITPKLDFSTRSIMVLGDGGQATAQLSTNLELEDLRQSIVYTSADEGGWISDLDISNGFLILQTDPNADPEALRNARITLSYRDGGTGPSPRRSTSRRPTPRTSSGTKSRSARCATWWASSTRTSTSRDASSATSATATTART